MKVELKVWAGLGLATALAGAGLAGCADEASDADDATPAAQAGEAGEGEGGESGEGGVDTSAAASDPIVYGAALAVAEAHVIAARDAYAAGETEAGAEMFAHPVSEVLLEMEPVFAERGVEDFKDLFSEASTAALQGASAEEIANKADGIIAVLRAAEEEAPISDASAGKVAAGIIADQLERSVQMYAQATETTEYGPYLDAYGYWKSAAARFEGSSDAILAENADLHGQITRALDVFGSAFPTVVRPESLDANQGAMFGAASAVSLGVS